jgi:hypothetical protein
MTLGMWVIVLTLTWQDVPYIYQMPHVFYNLEDCEMAGMWLTAHAERKDIKPYRRFAPPPEAVTLILECRQLDRYEVLN